MGLTEKDFRVCPKCKRKRFRNTGLCATCNLNCSNCMEPEDVAYNHLKLIAEILTLAARDCHRNYSKWATPTTQQRAVKNHAIKDQAQAKWFIAGKDDSTFAVYCNLLKIAPARTRRLILGMKK